jgi:hypothetical protein
MVAKVAGAGGPLSLSPPAKEGTNVEIRRHLSYANIGVTVCLFLILAGGAAYATGGAGSHAYWAPRGSFFAWPTFMPIRAR